MITAAQVAVLPANLDAGAFIRDPKEPGDGAFRVIHETDAHHGNVSTTFI